MNPHIIALFVASLVLVDLAFGQQTVRAPTGWSGSAGSGFSSAIRPTPLREHVDPRDPVERFLLLAPNGPLVIEVSLFIDGQPFNVPRETLIEGLLALADT